MTDGKEEWEYTHNGEATKTRVIKKNAMQCKCNETRRDAEIHRDARTEGQEGTEQNREGGSTALGLV